MSSYGLKAFTAGIIGEMIKQQHKEVLLLVENGNKEPWRTVLKVAARIAYIKILVSEYIKVISEPEQKLLT